MKSSDYITVGFIAVFVTVIGYFVVNSVLGDPKEAIVRFGYIDEVSGQTALPDSEIFNAAAINPTVEVYIGDCEDINQNGILDDDEREKCGEDMSESGTSEKEKTYLEANNGLSDEENEQINADEGYASGTTAQQREAVKNDIEQHEQEQQGNTEESQIDMNDPARRETVSGS